MDRKLIQLLLAVGLCLSGMAARSLLAQSGSHRVSWAVSLPFSDSVVEPDQSTAARKYREAETLDLGLLLDSETAADLFVNQEQLRQRIRVRLDSAASEVLDVDVAARVAIRDPSVGGGDLVVYTVGSEPLRLPANGAAEFTIEVRRHAGEAFGTGRYTIVLEIPNILALLKTESGEVWRGAAMGDARQVALNIKRPENAHERSLMYQLDADRSLALAGGATEEAVALLQAATSSDPTDARAQYMLGLVFVRAGRFAEAIPVLTALEARVGSMRKLGLALASAYVGQNDEAKAAEALLRSGLTAAQANSEVTSIKGSLRGRGK
jgi:hypothetical protein